jgi:hypothetical protein
MARLRLEAGISPAVANWEIAVAKDETSAADSRFEVADEVDEAVLSNVMQTVPLGAAVLAGSAVALLVLGYILIYVLVFLPRGTIG